MARGDANFGAAGKKGYMGGKYSRKAMNLTKKQLGKSGVAAARKRTVDISQTRREVGKTLGPGGKPLTGRVKMGNGNIAVYKAGKRVIAQKPKPAAPRPKTGTGSTGSRDVKKPQDKGTDKPKKPKDKIHTRNARDRAMAGRAGLTATSRGRTGMSGTVSSAGEKRRMQNRVLASRNATSASRPSSGNGSPAARIRSAVISAFAGRGGSSKPPASTGISQYQSSKAKSDAARKAAEAKKPKPKTKVVMVNGQATVADLQPDGTYKPRPRK